MKSLIDLIKEYYAFIERHWGDYVGLILVFTGVALLIIGSAVELDTGKELDALYAQSTALITTGVGLLKLRNNPKPENGNGNGGTDAPKPVSPATVADKQG